MKFRYSLSSLLLVLTLLCLWLGWHCSSAQKQHRAVAWLQARGCFIAYDGAERDAQQAIPPWLKASLGQDFFHRVVAVRFERPLEIDEAIMDRLDDLPGLRQLEARRCPLAPGVECRIAELSLLEKLELEVCSLNDDQLAALGQLTNLRELNVQHNPFQGKGLAAWKRLDNLQTLYLSDTSVSDENLVHLAELENLQRLYLGDTGLGDEGLGHVAKMSSLQHLSIDDLYRERQRRYTNAGISRLKALRNLERLDLGDFQLTVENVDALATVPRFRTLWVDSISDNDELKARLATQKILVPPFTNEAAQ